MSSTTSAPSPAREREQALFILAVSKPVDRRVVFLESECAGDAMLRARIEALLEAHEQPNPVLDAAAVEVKTCLKLQPPDEAVGQKIGPYKILERVGEGGAGVVYVAEQSEPVRRRVALKVIKLGMDTRQVVARFEAERQALAMMDHPNIAKVLDAGATVTGRPYFVMELVRGIKLTDFCDQKKLSTEARLDLFIQVCHAVQHAHQKGIIHRDLKPSNILVTLYDGVPVPKVIDFGIAKATEGRLTEATVYTQLHQFIGTPAYMSPEQAEMSGLDLDTRSDIYSLGVLLYELLTGRTPLDAKELLSQGLDAMRRTIREKEPLPPSTKLASLQGDELTTTAQRRSVETSKLAKLVRGDLDWIVMKCLEKDRARRYETANGLAMDLKRYRNNEAVAARPPSSLYRFQKAIKRNTLAYAAAGAVAAALLLGTMVSLWQAVRATSAKQQALAAQNQAVAAQAGEAKLRRQAQADELAARQRAYASDMNMAKQALDVNNLGRALRLLNRQRPRPGQRDLRGWEWRYLRGQARSDASFTLCQQSNPICSLAVSPDGRWLAVGTWHREGLSVWDLVTRQELPRLAENEKNLRAAFSPTEPLLAFASGSSPAVLSGQATLHLWNTDTRQMVANFPLGDLCLGLAFSQDGRTLATYTTRRITVWRVLDGTEVTHCDSEGTIGRPSFATTPDLSLAAYRRGAQIHVVALHDGKEVWTAVAAKNYVSALAFSPDGTILASEAGPGDESVIRLWEGGTGRPIGRLGGHSAWVNSLVFWPDGKRLASSSADRTIRIWDVAGRKCLDVLRGHPEQVWRLALLPDNKTLVSGGQDGTVCFWDTSVLHPSPPRITIPDQVLDWCFEPNSRSVLTLDIQGHVSRWTGSDFLQKSPCLDIGTNFFRSPPFNRFSPDGRFLAFSSTAGLQVWDLVRRIPLRQWTNLIGQVNLVSFLAEQHKLITCLQGRELFQEFDLTSGREVQSWRAPNPFGTGVGLSPDERDCVAAGFDGQVILRNLAAKSSHQLNLDILESTSGAFSPDSRLFAASSHLGFARVWDTASWGEMRTLSGYLLGVYSVAFSPDGRRLATGSEKDEALRLWDTESWQDVLTLEGQGDLFFRTAFSPDGNTIGAWDVTGILHFWHAPSWAEIRAAETVSGEAGQTSHLAASATTEQ